MTSYAISQQGIADIRRRWLIIFSVVCTVAIGIGIWLAWPTIAGGSAGILGLFPAVVFLIIFAVMIPRQIGQQVALWKSIVVVLGDNFVSREQSRIPPIRIQRSEITRIQETGTGLCVFTADKYRSLAIPASLDGYDHIKDVLSQWTPFDPISSDKARDSLIKNRILIVGILVSVAILFFSTAWWLVIPVSVALTGLMIYSYLTLRRLQGVDPSYRRRMAIGVILMIFFAAVRVIGVLVPLLRSP